jgi:hypothetical protein
MVLHYLCVLHVVSLSSWAGSPGRTSVRPLADEAGVIGFLSRVLVSLGIRFYTESFRILELLKLELSAAAAYSKR